MRCKYELLVEGALRCLNMLLRIKCLSWFKYLIIYRDKQCFGDTLQTHDPIKIGHDTGESLKIKMFSVLKKD